MNFPTRKVYTMLFAAVVCLMLIGVNNTKAQKVPISFNDFHGYTGTVSYIKDVANAYPNLTELIEIGKSNLHNRPIYVLVVSNMENGTAIDMHVELRNMRKENVQNVTPMKTYHGKPGHWLGGATHGNEYTGTEVCLYTINKLVSGYGSDPEITRILDQKVFYICPIINPDGVYNSVEGDMSQRANSMAIDNDRDGKINEDGPDDLNGDGHITQFRYKDTNGRYVIDDVDPRYMRQLGRNETTDKTRYSVIREGKDNDGDGAIDEDGEGGIDLNRNFPEGWFTDDGMKGGTGTYPTSAPESRAVVEFFTNNTNIFMSQFYHTSGGFTYRAMGTKPHSYMDPKDVAVFDRIMGKKYLEIIGEEVPEAWTVEGPLDSFREELRRTSTNKYAIDRGYVLPRGWRVSYSEDADRRYSYGMATDWAYAQFGAFSITTELWNSGKDMRGIPQFTGDDANVQRERAMLKYQDEEFGGKFFINWKSYNHPQRGAGEIGGWIPRYSGGNAFPGESLERVCDMHYRFELFRAGLMPEVVISSANARTLYTTNNSQNAGVSQQGDQVTISIEGSKGRYKIVEVTATIENTGVLRTHVARGTEYAGNRNDAVWLIGDRDKITFIQGGPFQNIGVLEGAEPIPGYEQTGQRVGQRAGRQGVRRGPTQGDRRQAQPASQGNRREVKWLLAIEGDTSLKVVVTSQKGGTKVQELTIR
ncbi:M14 family metallopeptidase [candidate division KSB1 bacterium]